MSNKQTLFNDGKNGYRIPSIVNVDDTLVAVADKGTTGADWGYIELVCRTSTDGGVTWSEESTIAAPPAREISYDAANTASAFFIDPCMTVAPNGDIVMVVTFFPESKGIHDKKLLDKKKVAFCTFDGANCPLIYDRDGNYYIVLADGTILDSGKAKTEYTVNFAKGDLFKGGEYCGNIFLNGAIGKSENDSATTFGAPLKAPKRSYVFMLKSSDKGATWSAPVDITADVISEANDGVFFAVAPGSGLTTKAGRIIMPIYTLNGTVAIYSDDNGDTWRRNPQNLDAASVDEWTAVQAPTGTLFAFSRAKKFGKTPVAVSNSDGVAWQSAKKAPFKAPKCQKNALVIGENVYVSHPSAKKREKGVISVGTFTYNKKGEYKGIKWDKIGIPVNDDFFAYSCMTRIADDKIGILYEDKPSGNITFEIISL